MVIRSVKKTIRHFIEESGYYVRHRSVLPLGIEYQRDIIVLSKVLNIPIRTFFDIGAHIGDTAVDALKNFPDTHVFAFEPHPATFANLTSRISDPRFSAYNLAISDRSGSFPFFEYGHLSMSNSLVSDNQFAVAVKQPVKRTINVEATTIDQFLSTEKITCVDVLKIDTEGHELAALRGAELLLQAGAPMFVFLEFNTVLPKQGSSGGALSPLADILETAGFTFVATYPVLLIGTSNLFSTMNALFVRPPN